MMNKTMRPIKFRVFDKRNKIMLGDLNGACGYEERCLMDCMGEDYELMQFTGLLDKNGKEIYEGDVIEAPGIAVNKVHGVVEYQTNNCNFTYAALRGAEVLGNIYENPELIK